MRLVQMALVTAFLVGGITLIADSTGGSIVGGVSIGVAVAVLFWAMERAAKEARR